MSSFFQKIQLNLLRVSVLASSAICAEAIGNPFEKLACFSLLFDCVSACYITNCPNNSVDSSNNLKRWTYR